MTKALEEILSRILGNNVDVNLIRDSIAIENLRVCSEKETSLLLTNPILAGEWNYEKNGNLKPENVAPNSSKKVWWKCLKGHEWLANINNRSNGRNCPYCSNKKLLKGYNDLATTNPALVAEWNYEKNGNLTPEDLIAGSEQKVWWSCSKGHEWKTQIKNRQIYEYFNREQRYLGIRKYWKRNRKCNHAERGHGAGCSIYKKRSRYIDNKIRNSSCKC